MEGNNTKVVMFLCHRGIVKVLYCAECIMFAFTEPFQVETVGDIYDRVKTGMRSVRNIHEPIVKRVRRQKQLGMRKEHDAHVG